MLRLSSKITIGEELKEPIIFDFVNEVEIDSSSENLTDTAKLIIPRKISFKGKPIAIGADALLKRGMSIKIELGYDDNLKIAFRGYISKLHLKVPLEIECEDEMWILKQNTLANKSYTSVSLSTLLKYIMPKSVSYSTEGFTFENLGKIRISNNATTAMVLDMLRKTYQINSFFMDGKLFIGVAFQATLQKDKKFGFEKNIISDSNLIWEDSEDVKIKVKGVSVQSDNKKVEHYYPSKDTEGQQMQFSRPNLNLDDLKKHVKRFYDSFHYAGYKGNFETFGEPFVNHGDAIAFTGEKLPERNEGKYLVRSVNRTFGQGGYRQSIELANKILNTTKVQL